MIKDKDIKRERVNQSFNLTTLRENTKSFRLNIKKKTW